MKKIAKMPKIIQKILEPNQGPKVRHLMDDAVSERCHGVDMFDHRKEARERGE